jgi:hypothetical protein
MIGRVSTSRNIHFSMSTVGCAFSGVHQRNSQMGRLPATIAMCRTSALLPRRRRVRSQKHKALRATISGPILSPCLAYPMRSAVTIGPSLMLELACFTARWQIFPLKSNSSRRRSSSSNRSWRRCAPTTINVWNGSRGAPAPNGRVAVPNPRCARVSTLLWHSRKLKAAAIVLTMTRTDLRKLLEQLRRMPNATPAEALEEFRRLLADETAKARKH